MFIVVLTSLGAAPLDRRLLVNVCPYGIIRTNRKTLALQRVDWFVPILFPSNPLKKIGVAREAKKRDVT